MISIIIPVFNEEKIIHGQLESLLPVSDEDIEVIAVDGGSKDRTAEIIAEFKSIRFLQSTKKGRAAQMNYGADKANGNILLFLHADVSLPKEWKSEVIKAVDSGFIAGGFRIRCGGKESLESIDRFFAYITGLRSRYAKYMYGDQAIFVTKNVFKSVSGFPEIPILEDYEFSRRIFKAGKIFYSRLCVDVSYRRFKHGVFTAALLMHFIPLLYRIGVSPHRLAKFYKDIR
ncbi:MAG: TIGR04283 family arsenosugar biosynthesis glycosyltransferase [Proteobacteria bacterium]|nr:TIGR04283 family arsenosugar biosynthesis glycosyltransferase [Pseudomonadota bacterium]